MARPASSFEPAFTSIPQLQVSEARVAKSAAEHDGPSTRGFRISETCPSGGSKLSGRFASAAIHVPAFGEIEEPSLFGLL